MKPKPLKPKTLKPKPYAHRQLPLSIATAQTAYPSKFISAYRVVLVKDQHLPFANERLSCSRDAQPIIKKLIEAHGQSDREQFCVLMLNTKNAIIGVNIVSTGTVSSAPVCPREVMKPAILANAASLIFGHNHPSSEVQPSPEDLAITQKLIQAAAILGITVHEHIIVSMFDDRYYSMADNGLIKSMHDHLS